MTAATSSPPGRAPVAGPERPPALHARVGRAGEDLIAGLLQRSGWTVRDRNWRPQRGRGAPRGELDIVAEREGSVSVFEVKTRSGADFGHPYEAVGAEKLRRLHVLARAWAREHDHADVPAVDVVAVHWPRGCSPRVEHLGSIGWL